jgi:hypothetical protein
MENNQDIIQAYLNGQLTEQARTAFEIRLKTEADLAAEVSFFKEINAVFQHPELMAVHTTVRNVRAEVAIEPDFDIDNAFMPQHSKVGKGLWGMGAIVLLLLLLSSWWIWQNQKATAELTRLQTVRAEFINKPISQFEDLIGTKRNSRLSNAMDAYGQHTMAGYQTAIPLFLEYLKQKGGAFSKDFVNLYLGICYAQTNQTEAAEKVLLPLQTIDNQSIAHVVNWHLSLCYLQEGRLPEAKILLENLKTDSVFGEEATSILGKL